MTKISALSDIGTSVAANDTFVLVDVSDPTTPNKKIQQQNLFLIPDGNATTPGLRFLNDTNTGIYRVGADQLALATNGTGRLFVDSSGNVGVGMSPTQQLSVKNSVTIGDATTTSSLGLNGATLISNAITNKAYWAASGCAIYLYDEANSGYLGFVKRGSSAAGSLSMSAGAAEILSTAAAPFGIYTYGSQSLLFGTSNNERLRITSDGKVGVGTSSPASAVDIAGNPSIVTLTSTNTGVIGADVKIGEIAFRTTDSSGGNAGVLARIDAASSQTFDGSGGAGMNLRFFAGNLTAGINTPPERMRITATGLVGIGTTSPSQALHVVGKGRFQESASSGAIAYIGADSTAAYIDTGTYASARPLAFKIEGTERARIDSSGRLLVGTSSASGSSLLQVNGDTVRIATAKTPASATATGTTGEVCWDANYVYVCVATNTWKRSALSTW